MLQLILQLIDIRTWVTIGALWVLCAIMAGVTANDKNRRFWVWFFFGLLTGPYALYRAIRVREVVPAHLAQSCPNCKKTIRKTARECPFCGHVLIWEPDPVAKAGRQAAAAVFLLRKAARKSTAAVKAEQAKLKEKRKGTGTRG